MKLGKLLSGFVHGQDQKGEHKDITKNFAGLHNHFALLTMTEATTP